MLACARPRLAHARRDRVDAAASASTCSQPATRSSRALRDQGARRPRNGTASSGPSAPASRGSTGVVLWIACELRDLHDGGDHVIVTGEVLEADARDGEPLLFHAGTYRRSESTMATRVGSVDRIRHRRGTGSEPAAREPAARSASPKITRAERAIMPISLRAIASASSALTRRGQRLEVEALELAVGDPGAGALGRERRRAAAAGRRRSGGRRGPRGRAAPAPRRSRPGSRPATCATRSRYQKPTDGRR